jgi:hypothetical protein
MKNILLYIYRRCQCLRLYTVKVKRKVTPVEAVEALRVARG